MNARSAAKGILTILLAGLCGTYGCITEASRCGPGQRFDSEIGVCIVIPADAAPEPDAGGGSGSGTPGGGSGSGTPGGGTSGLGDECTGHPSCTGDADYCAIQPPSPPRISGGTTTTS